MRHMSYAGTPQPAPPPNFDYPHIQGTDITRAPLDLFRTAVSVQINRAIPTLALEKIFDGVDILKKEGDFSVAMPRFRLGGKPDDWAAKVVQSFQPDECIESVKQVGPFLYFMAEPKTFARVVLSTIERETYHTASGNPEFGLNKSGGGKTVLIEYSAPNIAKQFHIGHLRSTIIGQFLINLYQSNGWNTVAANYLGDWGKQVGVFLSFSHLPVINIIIGLKFGLIAVGFERYGSEEALAKDAIKHLYEVYVKINADAAVDETVHDAARAYFKRMEDGEIDFYRVLMCY